MSEIGIWCSYEVGHVNGINPNSCGRRLQKAAGVEFNALGPPDIHHRILSSMQALI